MLEGTDPASLQIAANEISSLEEIITKWIMHAKRKEEKWNIKFRDGRRMPYG